MLQFITYLALTIVFFLIGSSAGSTLTGIGFILIFNIIWFVAPSAEQAKSIKKKSRGF